MFACDCDGGKHLKGGIMQHSPRPITCLSPASVSWLSGFRNPFPNPPSLSQLSRTSVSGQISRFDQELIYKVLLVLTTLGGGVVVLEIRIIGGCRRSCVGEMFWRSVLLTQGLARAAGCPLLPLLPQYKTFGAFGEQMRRAISTL